MRERSLPDQLRYSAGLFAEGFPIYRKLLEAADRIEQLESGPANVIRLSILKRSDGALIVFLPECFASREHVQVISPERTDLNEV